MTDNEKTYQNKKKGIPTLSIVPDALKYYDENNDRYQRIRKKIKYFEVKVRNTDDVDDKDHIETDHTIYHFYDRDKQFLFKSRVEYVGKHYTDQDVWIWAWALPHINKSDSSIIRNVFLYGTDINVVTSGDLDLQNLLLKNELVTSRSIITDKIQVDIHCALASYLAKKPMILPFSDFIGGNLDDYPLIPYTYAPIEDTTEKIVSHYVYHMYILDPPGV
jgi:Family of unknown function (DUF6882)